LYIQIASLTALHASFRARTRVYLALLTHKGKNQPLVDFLAGTSFGCLVECGPTNPESAADFVFGFHNFLSLFQKESVNLS
jgi:hypothetical protein